MTRIWVTFTGLQRGESCWDLPNAEKLLTTFELYWGIEVSNTVLPRYGARAISFLELMGNWVEPRKTHSSLS